MAAVVAHCVDPDAVAAFWALAAGWARVGSTQEGVSFRSPQRVGPYLELLPSTDVRTVRNRIHLDVALAIGEDHATAVEVLLEAGAAPVEIAQGDVRWTVLADPEGSEFCVLTPR